MLLVGIIVGLLILVLLVVVHELGHGIVAHRNGVKVEEFGVGFPPKAWAKKVASSVLGKDVLFSLNWLPLGGFVRLQGEHDSATKKGDYGAASYWVKTKILLAGVVMNWIIAALLITALAFLGFGKP
jgi:regulator of sigma E protease